MLKACVAEEKDSRIEASMLKINLKELDNRMEQYAHPNHRLEAYIKVSFKVLKGHQNKLLSKGANEFVDKKKQFLSKETEIKISELLNLNNIEEKDIEEFIQNTYLDETAFFRIRDDVGENSGAIPFNAYSIHTQGYFDEIKKKGVGSENIFQLPEEYGQFSSDLSKRYLSQITKFRENGKISQIIYFYRKINSVLSYSVEKNFRWFRQLKLDLANFFGRVLVNQEADTKDFTSATSATARYEYDQDEKLACIIYLSPDGDEIGRDVYKHEEKKSRKYSIVIQNRLNS